MFRIHVPNGPFDSTGRRLTNRSLPLAYEDEISLTGAVEGIDR